MKILWITLGITSLFLGLIGILLPLLPTTPFLLLSAFSFSRSSERLHSWLVNHRHLGTPIRNWQESGSISRPAKVLALCVIAATFLTSLLFGVREVIIVIQAIVLGIVSVFIITRPENV